MPDTDDEKSEFTNWMLRLKVIWTKRPGLKKSQKELFAAAGAFGFKGVIGDFEHKLRGTRPAGDAFAEILFRAAALDLEGLSLKAWTGTDEQWAENVESLATSRVRDEVAELISDPPLDVKLTSRAFPPTPGQTKWRRAGPPGDEEIVRLGEEMILALRYTGDRALLHVHVILLEYMGETADWQVFTSLPFCKIRSSEPVTFRPVEASASSGAGLGLDVGLGLKAETPLPGYELFVCLSATKFDYRVMSRLNRLDGKTALMRHAQVGELMSLLVKTQPDLIVGHATYTIR